MSDREKLIELIQAAVNGCSTYWAGLIADHLLANGVVVRETGEWKYYRKKGIAVCTSCSFERKVDDNFGRAVACPNCGADMRGAKSE